MKFGKVRHGMSNSVCWAYLPYALFVAMPIKFFVGLLFFTSGLFLPLLVTKAVFELIFTGSGLALASCIYLFAIIWVKDNLSCQN